MAVGRFQVMTLLQAARAHVLGLPLESAYSWGLNRAIFYAAAKRGFKGGGGAQAASGEHGRTGGGGPRSAAFDTYHLGDEMAYTAPGTEPLLFSIGGKTQTPEDFRRQVEARFQGGFKEAWADAVDYVGRFDRPTLLSGTEFFSSVYRPKRDEFAAKWTELSGSETKADKPVRAARPSRRPPSGRRRS